MSDRPAWQTDDLDEEWVDEDEQSLGTQSISLTNPLPGFLQTPAADNDTPGTFLIRHDVPAPKTPGRQTKKGPIKDFFSPLALERMFDPPSPPAAKPRAMALTAAPAVPSRLSHAFTPNDSRSDSGSSSTPPPTFRTPKPALQGRFTFTVPRQTRLPQAESTPGPPMTDPRLRLFQLQYDTFTREHLSAMVDSIAANTPSGGSTEGTHSRILQQTPASDDSPVRSIKRIKLSPPSDFYGEGAGAGAVISRPRVPRVDYVGESRSLMQQIKQARDFSTISTSVTMDRSLVHPTALAVTCDKSGSSTAAPSGHSSLAIRQQAANLMQQIKNDMRGSKRLFSGDTELSRQIEEDKSQQSIASRRKASPRRPVRSPRKPTRTEDQLAVDISNMSIDAPWQTDLIPAIRVTSDPVHPTSSLRSGNDDLNRFVSSSTASGTTITASSAPSFVKHSGPVHMTHISPSDVPSLPQRVGKMVYDTTLMKWVRANKVEEDVRDHVSVTDAESEDPFRDIESLREDDSGGVPVGEPPEQQEEVHEQAPVMSDEPSVAAPPANDTVDNTTASDAEEVEATVEEEVAVSESEEETSPSPVEETVVPTRKVSLLATPMPKSALKSTSATPVSAMKDPNRDKHTPAQKLGHRRSVSFSDGKRDGPIRGLSVKTHESDDESSTGYSPSARSKRIAEMMQDLEADSDASPTRSSTPIHDVDDLQLVGTLRASSQMAVDASCSRRSSRSGLTGNATFLTECSFGVAHDKLVQVITDAQPFEPHWEELSSIDLSKKALDSVARLKEFLPRLDALTLNCNQLSWLSGIPACLRTLSVASNVLTGVTSFSHLLNLEQLDISQNDIDSLAQLQCLRHLRELKADGNRISSLDGLEKLEALRKLSVQGNLISELDLSLFRWPRLEMLDLSQNRLSKVVSLADLAALTVVNLDGNLLDDLDAGGRMIRLRILRASNNRLRRLDVGQFTNLRTLYLDNNALEGLKEGERLERLENLSVRNQSCREFEVSTGQFRDVKRLYLSGNKLKTEFIEEACYNLVYLEAAGCRLTGIPRALGRLTPNLRVLNLNYNFLEDVAGLEGLTRLKKLTMIGSRLKGTKPLIRVLERMPEVEMVDMRMNPSTLGWYLPLLVRDMPGALQPSEQGGGWGKLDAKFRRDLPDDVYVGRLVYRGLVMRACPRLGVLDGVAVTEKERRKANQLLRGIKGG